MRENTLVKLITPIAQAIYDKKGFNILVLDVHAISTMTDYFVIAEGNVDRHVKALSHAIMDKMAEEKIAPFHLDGQQEGDWVVLDYGEVVVHLFTPEMREKYCLEKLWGKAKIVDVPLREV